MLLNGGGVSVLLLKRLQEEVDKDLIERGMRC